MEKRNLPSIKELYDGDVELKRDTNDLNILLNQKPLDKWLKKHPIAANVKYIPIERVEWLLTKIFLYWRVEIRQVQIIANSAVVTVRLFYRDVLSNEMLWQDGVGAAPIQTDKGAGATDFNKVKSDGVMKSVPAAESYAVKDAAEKIGKLFGKDLNRADQILYDSLANLPQNEDKHENLFTEETK
jgi:hypothetical protein